MKRNKNSFVLIWVIHTSLCFIILACPAFAQIEHQNLIRGVVKIIATKPDNRTEIGAGIVVGIEGGTALIVTALHVVAYEQKESGEIKEAQRIEVVFASKRREKFRAKLHEEWDEDHGREDPVQEVLDGGRPCLYSDGHHLIHVVIDPERSTAP